MAEKLLLRLLSRLKAEEERLKKEEEKARREFIKQEYLRRKQLKLMEDMDMLVKTRPATAKQKKPRPKSIHRDVIESPKTPVRATAGKGADALFLGKTRVLCATLSLLLSCSLNSFRSVLTGFLTLSNYLFICFHLLCLALTLLCSTLCDNSPNYFI